MTRIKNETSDQTTEYYIARTQCKNREGLMVTRYVGTVRGMSDHGYPGWCDYPQTHFVTLEQAQAVVMYPTSLNCYNSEYCGAPIEIIKVMVHCVTTTNWELVENNG